MKKFDRSEEKERERKDIFSLFPNEDERTIMCLVCSREMDVLEKEDVLAMNLQYHYPRGVYRCGRCRKLATITKVPFEGDWIDKIHERVT